MGELFIHNNKIWVLTKKMAVEPELMPPAVHTLRLDKNLFITDIEPKALTKCSFGDFYFCDGFPYSSTHLQEISFNLTVFKAQHGRKPLLGIRSSRIVATI